MNRHLAEVRSSMLRNLGLAEVETVCARIPCDERDLDRVMGAMRPRATAAGGRVTVYDPPEHKRALARIRGRYEAARGTIRAGFEGPVLFALVYHRRATLANQRRRRAEQDTLKPDVDNVAKLVMDALSGVAYRDDKQVVGLVAEAAPRYGSMDWYEVEVTYCEEARG